MGVEYDAKDLGYFNYPEGTTVHGFEGPEGYAAQVFVSPEGETLGYTIINPGNLPPGTPPDVAMGLKAQGIFLRALGLDKTSPTAVHENDLGEIDRIISNISRQAFEKRLRRHERRTQRE